MSRSSRFVWLGRAIVACVVACGVNLSVALLRWHFEAGLGWTINAASGFMTAASAGYAYIVRRRFDVR